MVNWVFFRIVLFHSSYVLHAKQKLILNRYGSAALIGKSRNTSVDMPNGK